MENLEPTIQVVKNAASGLNQTYVITGLKRGIGMFTVLFKNEATGSWYSKYVLVVVY